MAFLVSLLCTLDMHVHTHIDTYLYNMVFIQFLIYLRILRFDSLCGLSPKVQFHVRLKFISLFEFFN